MHLTPNIITFTVGSHSSTFALMDHKIDATMSVRDTDWEYWQNTSNINFHPSSIYINNKLLPNLERMSHRKQ